MKNIRINIKLTIAIFLINTLCISLLYLFAGTTLAMMMKNSEIAKLNDSLKIETNIIEEFVENQELLLTSFSHANEVSDFLKEPDNPEKRIAAQKYTEEYHAKLKNWEGLYIAEWDTHIIAHSNTADIGKYTRTPGDYLDLLHNKLLEGDVYNLGIIVSPVSQKLLMSMYCPVFDDATDEIIGYVGGGPYAEVLEDVLNEIQYKKASYYMFNIENNTYIFDPDQELMAQQIETEPFTSIVSEFTDDPSTWNDYVEYRDEKNQGYLIAYQYLPEYNWAVSMYVKKDIMYEEIDTCMKILLYVCIGSVIIITIISWIGITFSTKPLKYVEESITQLQVMNLKKTRKLDSYINKKSEIGQIATAIDSLYDSIGDMLEAEKEKQIAIAASESKAQFLANMSHEIRTPINTIIGMNEMIMRESNDEAAIKYSGNIKRASKMLLGIINDILDFSQIEAGKMRIVQENYNLLSMLNDAMLGISMRAKNKNLELISDFDKSLPSVLNGDEIRIKQILNNLLSNAVKYTLSGSVTLTAKGITEDNVFSLVLSVRDTGNGIHQNDINQLFSSFERLDLKKNRNIEGTGLGLCITKHLVELMNGKIVVESEYGKGSCFTITIPQTIIDSTSIEEAENNVACKMQENTDYFRAPEARVLAVDDNELNLEILAALLKRTEIQLTLASSGNECLEKTMKEKYDLILIDHMMPEPDGVETLNIIRNDANNLNHKTEIVVLTANAGADVENEYLNIGFSDYLSKPIDVKKLEEILAKYLK